MWPLNTPIEIGTRWLQAVAQGSTLLGLFMIALVWSGLSFHFEGKRIAAERATVQNSDNLARAFEEHLARSLKDIDRSLKIMRSRYVQYPDELDFRNWLRNSQLFDDQTVQVGIIGPDGFLKLSSIDTPSSPKTDLSDREHFGVHVDAKNDDLFISKAVIGRTSGKWSVQLTRRIENADGSFGGVVVASLDPSYLSRFYDSVDVGGDGYVSIVGVDGIIRALSGRASGPLGTDLSGAALFKHYPKESTGWYYSASSFSDGIPRLVTYRTVKDYPLIVTIGLSTPEIFSAVYADRREYYLVATALTLLILVVIGLSVRARWLGDRMAEDLDVQNSRLNQTRKFLDTIIENVPVPIVVKKADTLKFVLVNQAYEAFIGRPRDKVIGRTVFDLFPSKDAELITKFDDEAVQFNKRLIMGDFPVKTPANGLRVLNTTRLVVCDENEKPEHLIVVIDDVTEKKKAEENITYMAHHDPLTGLLNRARFNERLDEALARVGRGGPLAVLLLDLDQFKQVNDTRGHPVGDELLKAVADRLRGCVREIDFVARLGGDEFAIIQTATEQPADISALADRIRAAIMAPYDLGGLQAVVGVSIGVSLAPDDATASVELMKRADMALYRAKRDGRGIYRFFKPELDIGIGGYPLRAQSRQSRGFGTAAKIWNPDCHR
jgi:diguanylate cyclase (GGDEF)-like protein/PAS domain S-box-containing protein